MRWRAGCYYASTTSYAGPELAAADGVQPAQGVHPALGEGDTAAEREALLRKNSSILDMVSERAKALSNDLGPGEKARLSDYLLTAHARSSGAWQITGSLLLTSKNMKVPDAPFGETRGLPTSRSD